MRSQLINIFFCCLLWCFSKAPAATVDWKKAQTVSRKALQAFYAIQLEPITLSLRQQNTFAEIITIEEGSIESIESTASTNVENHATIDCHVNFQAQFDYLDKSKKRVFISSRSWKVKNTWKRIFSELLDDQWEIVHDASISDVVMHFGPGDVNFWADKGQNQLISVLSSEFKSRRPPLGLLTARRQDQLAFGKEFYRNLACAWSSSKIIPESFDLNDPQECQKFFSLHQNTQQVWVGKDYEKIECKYENTCNYILSTPKVIRGTKLLRNRFGRCATQSESNRNLFVVQEAIKDPLLIHSRRCKIHIYLLVASANPLVVLIHPGIVTLGSNRVSVEQEFDNAVQSTEALMSQSTNALHNLGHLTESVWTFQRFIRHLDTFEICKLDSTCLNMWKAMKKITNIVVEASAKYISKNKRRFQLFDMSFWVTATLDPLWSHGSEDVSLLYHLEQSSDLTLSQYSSEIFRSAIQISEVMHVHPDKTRNISLEYAPWEVVKHEIWEEKCQEESYRADPCFKQNLKNLYAKDEKVSRGLDNPIKTASVTQVDLIDDTMDGNGMALPSDTVMTSPVIKLEMKRYY